MRLRFALYVLILIENKKRILDLEDGDYALRTRASTGPARR